MNDTSPEIETFLTARYAALSGPQRLLMALEMFETARQVVLSSLDPSLDEQERRRELFRRFYGDALAHEVFSVPMVVAQSLLISADKVIE